MVLLKKQITYKDKPYEVRWEESYDEYHDYTGYGGYRCKIIELVLYEIKESKFLWFNRKDYKEIYKLNVTDFYEKDYIEQINKLFKAYEIILCKEREKHRRISELEDWDGII